MTLKEIRAMKVRLEYLESERKRLIPEAQREALIALKQHSWSTPESETSSQFVEVVSVEDIDKRIKELSDDG